MKRVGPDHDPAYTVRCCFDGRTAIATAHASAAKRPKKAAEILAAAKILALLGEDDGGAAG